MPWDIGSWELLVLAIIAVIFVGPKELPQMLRTVGQWMAKARAMARQFQRSFEELAREAELEDLRKGVDELKSGGPVGAIKRELEQSIDPIKREFGDYDPTATKPTPTNVKASPTKTDDPSSQDSPVNKEQATSSDTAQPKTAESEVSETRSKTSA